MSKRERNHSAAFKVNMALEAIKREKTKSELSSLFTLPRPDSEMEEAITRRFKRCNWCIREETKT